LLQASKGTRIRQGGPDEDKELAAHVLELTPKPQLLTEAAQLCELLILLRHEGDAGILQQVWPGSSPLSLCCGLGREQL
jgi:elongator complex protein 1